jgi:ArsR family transcriptional regulator
MAKKEALPSSTRRNRWVEQARLLGVMAHPVRLAILEILCERSRCVKHINALVPLAQSHLSQHLSALRKVGLVASLTCGSLRCYYVVRPTLVKKLIWLLQQEHPVEQRDCRSLVSAPQDRWNMSAEDVDA